MTTQALNQTLTLTDGRVLGYAESGDPKGRPFFLFHGLNSSRLEVIIAHEAMLKAGIRGIGIDRPGMGLSAFQKDRTVLDFTEDVEALADHLGIEKFFVMAVSAGTPYALGCIYKIPHRIISCGIISGVAPVFTFGVNEMAKESRIFILLAQRSPWLIKYRFWFLHGRISQNTAKEDLFLEGIMFALDDVDKNLIKIPSSKKVLLETFREGYRQGSKGVAYDGILAFGKLWGFELENVDFRPIHLWHGEKDKGIPLSMVKFMAQNLSGATLKTYPKEGHLSIIFNELDEILDDFLKRRS
jgi:pimeloyl-ACP methyl ester carboxylesterase